jgi:hypothetical protein
LDFGLPILDLSKRNGKKFRRRLTQIYAEIKMRMGEVEKNNKTVWAMNWPSMDFYGNKYGVPGIHEMTGLEPHHLCDFCRICRRNDERQRFDQNCQTEPDHTMLIENAHCKW